MSDAEATVAASQAGLEALRDTTGWLILRRPGHNLSARGHTWTAAFEQLRIAEAAGEFTVPEIPALQQRSLFE